MSIAPHTHKLTNSHTTTTITACDLEYMCLFLHPFMCDSFLMALQFMMMMRGIFLTHHQHGHQFIIIILK
jgi:hypothetical protein